MIFELKIFLTISLNARLYSLIVETHLIPKYIILYIGQVLIIAVNSTLRVRVRGAVWIGRDGTSGCAVDGWFFRAGGDRSSNIILRGCLQPISVRERSHRFRGVFRVHWSPTGGRVQQKQRLISAPSAFLHHLLPTWTNLLHGRVVKVDPYLNQDEKMINKIRKFNAEYSRLRALKWYLKNSFVHDINVRKINFHVIRRDLLIGDNRRVNGVISMQTLSLVWKKKVE